MNYKGFEIIIEKYIEKRHPQYNYLSFTAKCREKYLNAVFHDLDMRLKSEDELLEIFLKGLDNFIKFIEYNTDTSALPPIDRSEDIVRPADITKETAELQDKELVS